MTSATEPYGHSLTHRVKRAVMSSLHRQLPEGAYIRLYDAAFAVLRRARRIAYARFWAKAKMSGNKLERRRVETVLKAMPYSLVGWRGLEVTYDAVVATRHRGVPGSLVECGVAEGGSAAVMGLVEHEFDHPRMLWLFDSYEGLPDPTGEDFVDGATGTHIRPLPRGSCLGTFEQVSGLLFDSFGLRPERIRLVKGWFQDTLPATRDQIGSIAVLRIDGDWYSSVKCCLDSLFDSVAPGGYVIIDDYAACFGAQKAVDEFLAARGLQVDLTPDGRGGSFFVRPAISTARGQ
jgi:O-methyltransferase